jgi:hypothetical protein
MTRRNKANCLIFDTKNAPKRKCQRIFSHRSGNLIKPLTYIYALSPFNLCIKKTIFYSIQREKVQFFVHRKRRKHLHVISIHLTSSRRNFSSLCVINWKQERANPFAHHLLVANNLLIITSRNIFSNIDMRKKLYVEGVEWKGAWEWTKQLCNEEW